MTFAACSVSCERSGNCDVYAIVNGTCHFGTHSGWLPPENTIIQQMPDQFEGHDVYIKDGEPDLTILKLHISFIYLTQTDLLERLFDPTQYISVSSDFPDVTDEWKNGIYETMTFPSGDITYHCHLMCALKSTCEVFVVNGRNCHLGNKTTFGGSPTILGKQWTLYMKKGVSTLLG